MIRSDVLASWHTFLSDFPAFADALGMPNRIRLVVDANIVLGDLRWLVVKRKDPEARTTLEEVIAAGTVVVYVPPVLHRDVEKGLRDLSAEEGIPLEQLTAAWGRYRTILHTLDAPPTVSHKQRPHVRDPDDLPYIDLQVAIQASAIYTDDPDLRGMNAPVVGKLVMSSARQYAREASVSFTISVGGAVVCTAGIGLLIAMGHLAAALARRIRSLPESVQLVLLGTGLVILLHPAARAWFNGQLQRLAPPARQAVRTLMPRVVAAMEQATRAANRAEEAWTVVRSGVPANGPLAIQPLRVHVVVACIEARRPLTIDEITNRVRTQGFRAGRAPSASYLRSVLRGHPSLKVTSDGTWTLATA